MPCAHYLEEFKLLVCFGNKAQPKGRLLSFKTPRGIVHIGYPTFYMVRDCIVLNIRTGLPAADAKLDNGLSVKTPIASRWY